ncbi:MAG: NAD(P)H-hydrate dehydratase [Gemmataceae bacterium]
MDIVELPTLPPRAPDSHKGDFGRILVVAGSRGMSGAAILCARAALRGGAGLVRVACPESVLPIVAAGDPCFMTVPLAEDVLGRLRHESLAPLQTQAAASTVVALGPGLGRSDELSLLIPELLESVNVPIVLDADALNALDVSRLNKHAGPLVLTPHPGEFARLAGLSTAEVQKRRRELAEAFAREHKVVVLLKGHETIVSDGDRVFVNSTGNPGMATGGAGDVLTGLIAALIGQGLDPFEAACMGAYVHGLAGDLAFEEMGEVSLIATDILDHLPEAMQNYLGNDGGERY